MRLAFRCSACRLAARLGYKTLAVRLCTTPTGRSAARSPCAGWHVQDAAFSLPRPRRRLLTFVLRVGIGIAKGGPVATEPKVRFSPLHRRNQGYAGLIGHRLMHEMLSAGAA